MIFKKQTINWYVKNFHDSKSEEFLAFMTIALKMKLEEFIECINKCNMTGEYICVLKEHLGEIYDFINFLYDKFKEYSSGKEVIE